MDYEPFEKCLWAFVRRDYPLAATIAMEILQTGVSLGMMQLLLISMRRMGMSSDDDAIGQALPEAGGDPWETTLLDVTLGRRDPAPVIAEADGALQRCQALCYAGMHLITTGDLDTGRRYLRECLLLGVHCMETLRKALLDPLGIDDRARLFVAPDAQLYTLPLEILPLRDGRLVIDTHEITYLATGRDLIPAHRTAPEPAGPPVVIADPDYDLALDTITDPAPREGEPDVRRTAGLCFARLPGTYDEGRHVASLLGVEAWLGADAVEGRLKQQRSPVILHIATHGYFLHDNQSQDGGSRRSGRRAFSAFPAPLLNSGLALAGANTWLRRGHLPGPAEDGLLTAADLATMDLSGTELVVLSACDTGRGLVAVGQGVYGLRRSVGIAGARTLLMSLWQVPDRETQELMEDFYGRLQRGEPRGSAFRAAQLAMRARSPDPYYWGRVHLPG